MKLSGLDYIIERVEASYNNNCLALILCVQLGIDSRTSKIHPCIGEINTKKKDFGDLFTTLMLDEKLTARVNLI